MFHVTGLIVFAILWLIAMAGFADALGPVVRRLRILLPRHTLPPLSLRLPAPRGFVTNRI